MVFLTGHSRDMIPPIGNPFKKERAPRGARPYMMPASGLGVLPDAVSGCRDLHRLAADDFGELLLQGHAIAAHPHFRQRAVRQVEHQPLNAAPIRLPEADPRHTLDCVSLVREDAARPAGQKPLALDEPLREYARTKLCRRIGDFWSCSRIGSTHVASPPF